MAEACNNQEMFVWKRDAAGLSVPGIGSGCLKASAQDKFVGCASLQQFNDAPGKAELGAKFIHYINIKLKAYIYIYIYLFIYTHI